MLSLASNISSTQAVESNYSASFDGTDDYIDTGQTFQSVFRGDFSISFWMKPSLGRTSQRYAFNAEKISGGTQHDCYFETRNESQSGIAGVPRFVMTGNSDVGEYHTDPGDGSGFSFASGAASSWTHFLITVDLQASGNTIVKIYVNGIDRTHVHNDMGSSGHSNYTSDSKIVIGARNFNGTISKYYTGGITEFAIFNTVLDSDAAVAIYNGGSPLNLTFDQGNYDNSSALQAYYRMGNGLFDDKANGVVHDQDNAGFGSNSVTNGTFDSDLSSWTVINDSAAEDSITWHSSGRAKIIYDADGTQAVLGITQDTLTAGKVYRCKLDVEVIKASSTIKVLNEAEIVSGLGEGTHVFYFRATNTHFRIYRNSASLDCELYIDNVIVEQLNGNPALTSGGVTFSSDNPTP